MTAQQRLAPGKYALRIEDYLMLADAGAFADKWTELIEGDVVVMAPQYRPHAYIRDELSYRLRRALEAIGSDVYVMGGSVWLSENDMPQPDIVLTREPVGEGAIPLHSVVLLVEVSSATLLTDLGTKQALYAEAKVPEYWVVDVNARIVHQMCSPSAGTYANRMQAAFGTDIKVQVMDGPTIPTADL